jgi:UDP-galactopyranose mutase
MAGPPSARLEFRPLQLTLDSGRQADFDTNHSTTVVNMPTRYVPVTRYQQHESLTVVAQIDKDPQAPRSRFRRTRTCRKARKY